MKKLLLPLIAIILVLAGCNQSNSKDDSKLKIVTTN